MSGFVGLLNLDGAPLDGELLARLVSSLASRGPDRQGAWCAGPLGLGHTLLATTSEAWDERQPFTLDEQVWVVADARLDARQDLHQALRGAGEPPPQTATDVELVLRAYRAWGGACLDHLLGDFAFAIWDGPASQLFCARDHFGVRPFYYAQLPGCLVFSNTLSTLRLHPHVPSDLNDQAIADFLLFGYNQEPDTTAFAAVRRLPPAHSLCWSPVAGVRLRRYWTLPIEQVVRYKRQAEYVEHFQALFQLAVGDRLRTAKVGVSMSGGLDSTAVAAAAHRLLAAQGDSTGLRAFTTVYERLIPDQERQYAQLAADALGLPVHFLVGDDYPVFVPPGSLGFHFPQPVELAMQGLWLDAHRLAERQDIRVILYGYGGDPLLYGAQVVELLGVIPFFSLCTDLARCLFVHRKLPALGTKVLRQRLGRPVRRPTYPPWLNKDLEQELDLPLRWAEKNESPPSPHPTHPDGYNQTFSLIWTSTFENYEPGASSFPQEARYPFFDLRLVRYVLSLPPIPWCVDKLLLREALRGVLPDQIVDRPKTPLAGDPISELLRQPVEPWSSWLAAAPEEFSRYIDREAFHRATHPPELVGYNEYNLITLPVSLSTWLQVSV